MHGGTSAGAPSFCRFLTPHQHQQSAELLVLAVSLPKIDELADHLKITSLVVPGTVNPIERRQEVPVRLGADKPEGMPVRAQRLS